jgi:hypothetical protein
MTLPTSQDNILRFSPGGPIQIPAEYNLPDLPLNVYSKFGFKIIELEGSDCNSVKVWTPATEDEYRATLARLHNIKVDEVIVESAFGGCSMFNGVCTGSCASTRFCVGIYDPRNGLIGCTCV